MKRVSIIYVTFFLFSKLAEDVGKEERIERKI